MARLADRTGAAVGAVYRYFPGKQAIIAALQVEAISVLGRVLDGRLAEVPRSTDDRACSAARILVTATAIPYFAAIDPGRLQLLGAMFLSPRTLLDDESHESVTNAAAQAMLGAIAALNDGVSSGILQPENNELRTFALVATSLGLLAMGKRNAWGTGGVLPERVIESALTAMLRGWGLSEEDQDIGSTLAQDLVVDFGQGCML